MLHITQSNRFEYLLERLLQALGEESCGPLDTQWVIVPSLALRRRVELALAEHRGVCAQVQFPFPAQWLWAQMGRVISLPADSPFSAAILCWRTFEILGEAAFVDAHPPLARYLRDADPVMRLDLARRAAQLLERYVTYRPDWLEAWAQGRDAHTPGAEAGADLRWQAALWRRITADLGIRREHPAGEFLTALAAGTDGGTRLARAAHFFCLPSLPPMYLRIVHALAQHTQLRLYALNPCAEYWFDIVDRKRLSRLEARGEAAYHEVGHALLASWGRQAQTHLAGLLGAGDAPVQEDQAFIAAGGERLLCRLQDAILALHEPEPGQWALAPGDRSIELHVCHSRTRQLEVLHDRLLDLFAGDDPPRPDQVLVAFPDLEAAAPAIDAVFGATPPARRIPYLITGRPASRTNPPARVLLLLMDLCAGRFTAPEILDLLQQDAVAARFGFDPPGLDRLRQWIDSAGVRWGLDARDRERLDLPPGDHHSLGEGLSRLFLGFALGSGAGAATQVVDGRLPATDVEGEDGPLLARARLLSDALAALRDEWLQPHTAEAWCASLNRALERFVAVPAQDLEALQAVRAVLQGFRDSLRQARVAALLPLAVVRTELAQLLDDPARGGVPGGAVTFCALGSLRTLPYRVVCVLDLDDGLFPRRQRSASFDLMAAHPRPGDPNAPADDRSLFLDLVLGARDCLHLSHTGRSVRTNEALPPAVLVAELLDHLVQACARPGDPGARDAVRRQLEVVHPLQGFSRRAFDADADPRLRSFNAEYAQALAGPATGVATSAAAQEDDAADTDGTAGEDDAVQAPLPVFFGAQLEAAPETGRLSLDALRQFFRHPAAALLRERLGLRLERDEDALADAEPFAATARSQRHLGRLLLDAALQGAPAAALRAIAQAHVDQPRGAPGEAGLEPLLASVARLHARLQPVLAEAVLPAQVATLTLDVTGGALQLDGLLAGLRPSGLVCWQYGEAYADTYLDAWISHLFLCAVAPAGVAARTRWLGTESDFHLRPVEDARSRLADLAALRAEGLCAPLPLPPRCAWALITGNIGAARQAWAGREGMGNGVSADPAWALALRGDPQPLGARFEALAHRVYGPLDEHLEPRP